MKNISLYVKDVRKILDDNSPVILTGVAIAGTVATAVLTFKGSHAAAKKIVAEQTRLNTFETSHPLSKTEKFVLTYKYYIPAAVAVVGSSTCMVMATKIGLNRTAAMAGAFVIAERGSEQYKEKVKELLGEKQHVKVTDAVAQDQVDRIPESQIIIVGEGTQPIFDRWSGRVFEGTMEKLKQAENKINHEVINGSYASLSQFYDLLGLDHTAQSDHIGWSAGRLIELETTSIIKLVQGREVAMIAFDFNVEPLGTFQDGHGYS